MIRHARRGLAVTLALAFLMGGVGDALGSHRCPHHDGVDAAAGHQATGHDDHEAAAGDHGACTCVGRCHAGAAPSIAAPAAVQAAPVAEVRPLSLPEPPPARTAILPFSLPWGNAPPTL